MTIIVNVLRACRITTSTTADLTPPNKRNRFSFRSLQISHECVFVLREVSIWTGNLPVHETLFDLANEKSQFALLQRSEPTFFECFDIPNRERFLDPGGMRHCLQIRIAARRRRIADPATAINAVVEDI